MENPNWNFERIPLELRQFVQWVVWDANKVPHNPKNGLAASVSDRQTWGSFEEAVEAYENGNGRHRGIGFVLTDRDPYAVIDLDHSDDPAEEDRQRIIFQKFDSYTETSPSGKGGHIWIKANVPSARRGKVELYSSGRYMTVTGNVFHDAPIKDRQELAYELREQMRPQSSPLADASQSDQPATESDEAVLARLMRSRKMNFDTLWSGEWHGLYPSQSEADQALVNMIAGKTKNRDQIARLFRRSGLGHRAKAQRDDYVFGMVDKALDGRTPWDEIPGVDLSGILAEAFSRLSRPATTTVVTPVDLWANFDPPELPDNLLPPSIEQFARVQAAHMGADPGGLAMSALAVSASAIPDHVRVQVKRHDGSWTESARIWVSLIGTPSTKKTPIIATAAAPLRKIDSDQFRAFIAAKAKYDALDKDDKKTAPPPQQVRLVLNDTTVEAAQEVLQDSPHGVLLLHDELSRWFGSMEKYAGNRGAAKDRGFWLESFNGGAYGVNRVGRGATMIDNLSVSMLGGIQPDAIRKVAADTVDDGFLQRLFPIMLRPATTGHDEPKPDVAASYAGLIGWFTRLQPTLLHFDDEAQSIRAALEKKHMDLQAIEMLNPKLAAHIGKYDGLFARLCVIWHCAENANTFQLPTIISGATARRVADFLHGYLLPHAISFFVGLLGVSNDQDALKATAGYILSRSDLSEIAFRDVARGDSIMRTMDRYEATRVLEQLEALGWLFRKDGPRPGSSPRWDVNPECHRLFAERGAQEQQRRDDAKRMIADALRPNTRH